MNMTDFSLLYPDAEAHKRHYSDSDSVFITKEVMEQLGLCDIIKLNNSELRDFFTTDPEIIEYRLEIFSDMLDNPEIGKTLVSVVPILGDIIELRRLEADSGNTESYLLSISEIELYISCIDRLQEGFSSIGDKIKSRAFKAFAARIAELSTSEYYKELNAKLDELTKRVREIKSVTVGVNLDAQLRPVDAGVLSINPEYFKSGDVIEKILRMDFKDDEYTCIASLVPFGKNQSENQQMALSFAFNSAINEVYKASLRSWKKIVRSYVLENTDFIINLLPEMEFLVNGTKLLRRLSERGLSLCRPELAPMDERAYDAHELYNPQVALKVEEEIVTNDITFDEKGMIYVLTGPNRGGKSVITCALGLSFAMAQLGLFVPAKSLKISPADAIFTHFPQGAEDTIDKGRLGEECARMSEIFERVTSHSLVLLDESLSSTGSYEASYIAAEVLAGFSRAGCRCIFSTHLHELSAGIDAINAKTAPVGGVKIDTLVAGIDDGKRSFKIVRAVPDGKSYARDIADKYGLSYEKITEKIEKKES